MALITTAGAADAESYATVAEADAYHDARGNTTWTGLTTAKEQALRRATTWLDGVYKARWPGTRTFQRIQTLDWPRINAYDVEDEIIDSRIIPREVIAAVSEAALRELTTPGSLSPDVVMGDRKMLTGLKGVTWTPLVAAAGPSDLAPTLLAVKNALAGIVRSGGSVPIVRA